MTIEPEFSLDQPSQINHLAPDGVLAKDRLKCCRFCVEGPGAGRSRGGKMQSGGGGASTQSMLDWTDEQWEAIRVKKK